jgi:hypothetical protein
MSVKDMTNEQLIKEWESLNGIVDNNCFFVPDIVRFHLVTRELENRGYKIKTIRSLVKE